MSQAIDVEVAIVGTGFSGLGTAIYLQKAGIDSFALLEKSPDLGGTWRDNSYPGAACDVPSHLYSFSFEPNPEWSRAYSPQSEILAYLKHCATKYNLMHKIQFGFAVAEAHFEEETGTWLIRSHDGRTIRSRALVLGNGALHLPSYPDVEGRDQFQGKSFHSAQWDHSYDLRCKRVAVIGTGASAIQFVPKIAEIVDKMLVFQRTPPWITPKPDRAFSSRVKRIFARSPVAQTAYRAKIYLEHESRAVAFVSEPRILKFASRIAQRHLTDSVRDESLRAALTPNYLMGCKRVLISNDYYPALQRPNVTLVTSPIDRIVANGIRLRDGTIREVDTIIYGTGFSATRYLSSIRVYGLGGREINEAWARGAHSFLGITVAGFPNLFLMMGPNTILGHNSMIFMLEAQARYATQGIQLLRSQNIRSLNVRESVQNAFQSWLRTRLEGTVWATGCRSWYIDDNGINPVIWPSFTVDYWMKTRRLDLKHYETSTFTAVHES